MKKTKEKRFAGDPHLYKVYPISQKKYNAECLGTFQKDGIEYRCSFSQRTDNLVNQIKKGIIHKCSDSIYKKPNKTTNSIADFFQNPDFDDNDEEQYSSAALNRKLIIFIARKNLSMKVGTSNEMYDLIKFAFCCGCAHGNPKNIVESANSFIRSYKQEIMTKKMKEIANEIDEKAIKYFCGENMYTTVSIDEGSTKGRKMLDFCLENPFHSTKSYPAFTYVMSGIAADDYVVAITTGLTYLETKGVHFGAIIMDQSTAQVKAFKSDYMNSIRHRAKSEVIKTVLTISCACHKVQNTFRTTLERNSNLAVISDVIHSLSEDARDRAKEIGFMCPKHNNTRWIDDYSIMNFLYKHKAEIDDEYIDTTEFKYYFEICTIFKSLIEIFENPTVPLSEVYPYCLHAAYALSELFVRGNKIARPFIERINDYILNGKHAGQYALAFLLTPKGHSLARKLINGKYNNPNPKDIKYLPKFKVKEGIDIDSIEEAFDEIMENAMEDLFNDENSQIELSEKQRDFNPPLEEILEPPNDKLTFNDQTEEESEEENKEDKNKKDSLLIDELFEVNIDNIINYAINYLEEALSTTGVDEDNVNISRNLFVSWIELDNSPFSECDNEKGNKTYDFAIVKILKNEWQYICDIALRLRSCPCSEASCERTISAQRLLLTAQRLRSSDETIDARLIIMKGFENDNS